MALKRNKLTKASEKVGQAIAQSQYKAQAAKKAAQKKVTDMVKNVSKTAEKTTKKGKTISPFKQRPDLTIREQIGFAAGDIYAYLSINGKVSITKLVNAIMRKKNSQPTVYAAIGWLSREDKLNFSDNCEEVELKTND